MEAPELYHPDILALAQNPSRWREEHDAQYIIKAYNPVCGDKFEIRLDIEEVITDASFFGYGCVVSKASTALLTELIVGMTVEDARQILRDFIDQARRKEVDAPFDARFRHFMVARKFPGRVQCVVLGWEAMLSCELFRSSDNMLTN